MDRMRKNSLWGIVLGMLAVVFSVATTEAANLRDWGKQFPNASGRFEVLAQFNDEAVLDKETQLVWEQSPGDTNGDMDVDVNDRLPWAEALFHCANKTVGERKGWRLPAFYELASLVDPSVPFPGPTLPAGHPFSNVQSAIYRSATSFADTPDFAWVVDFDDGVVTAGLKNPTTFVWCVRGGSPGPSQY